MTNHRTPAEIERDIEQERMQLASSLHGLRQSISVEGITRQIASEFSAHGGEFGRAVSRSVKDNPIALALTGVGLAWMIFGDSQNRSPSRYDGTGYDRSADAYPEWDSGSGSANRSATDKTDGKSGVMDKVGNAAASASNGVSGAADSLSRGWDDIARTTGDAARTTRIRGAELRDRVAEGTEELSDEARRRVIAAREAAIDAWSEIERSSKRSARQAADLFEDQPLIAGALALAVGAALGSALPRSKAEDDAVGEQRDKLFAEASRIYDEERSKVVKTAKSVARETKAAASDLKNSLDGKAPGNKTAAEAVGDELESAAKRVSRKAASEADKQGVGDLGKPARQSRNT